ncbi:unnamed protein product [Rotaria sordida]|uniref:Uncharacterized protein n=1 Tax=Rotaria sordida TaxID=392033 RepID=A0A814Q556_9BILA|nr:unnamed protein product [Rotaria sordida]CAF1114552.1 unnamed protein product [Rotaria sordida]
MPICWPYTLLYLSIHIVVFFVINKRLVAGRLYIPKKNLTNQTVIVTGAASGIGRVTALELAKQQARVIVGIRGQERAEHVAQQLSKESHGNVIGYHLDLSDLASVKVFAEKIDKVDILINNAGVNKKHKELTNDGLESTFGTNHIGHFYLTQLLLPLLIQSNGRIVNVSSIMHILANENIDFSKTNAYNTMLVYAESKLANILHIVELQRRYGASHSKQSFDEVIKFRCYFDIKEENIDNKGNFTLPFVLRCLDLLLVQGSNVRASDTQLLDLLFFVIMKCKFDSYPSPRLSMDKIFQEYNRVLLEDNDPQHDSSEEAPGRRIRQ